MPACSGGRPAVLSEEGDPDPRDRRAFERRITKQYADALRKLDPITRAEVSTTAQKFFARWQASTSDDDLSHSRWVYKTIQCPGARSPKVKQIHVGGTLRVALITVVSEKPSMWFLLVYQKREQKRAIERACGLARTIGEE